MPEAGVKSQPERGLQRRAVLGMRVDATSYQDAAARVLAWALERAGRYVCVANVHMVMESYDDAGFARS